MSHRTYSTEPDRNNANESAGWLNRVVLGAGLTSALGDFCYETATVILPGLLSVLGLSAGVLGLIEGAAEAVACFAKLAAGYVADKIGHRKLLVLIGYGLTPLGQGALAFAMGWPLLLIGRLIAWLGKGLRGPLRDAIVVQAVTPQTRGRAMGFHRAADSVGAVLGPLLGVLLLNWAHGHHWDASAAPFRLVLWMSVLPGTLAVLAFLILVPDPRRLPNPTLRFVPALDARPVRFKRYLAAIGLFGLGDFSPSLLILAATRLLAPSLGILAAAEAAGLLYLLRNVVQTVLSYPVGALADRLGHVPMLAFGYALGALTAILATLSFCLSVHSVPILAMIFVVGGGYVAVEEALESTVTAELVSPETVMVSYGVLGSVNGVAKFASSALVGVLWTSLSPAIGFATAAALMSAGTVALLRV